MKNKLRKLKENLKNSRCSWSVAAENLDSRNTFYYRENERVGTASVIKIAIATAIFEKIENKELSLNQKLKILDEDKTIGTGVLKFLRNVSEISLYDVINLMISYSDNTATNICLRVITRTEVNDFLRKKGFMNTTLEEDFISKEMIDNVIYRRKKHTLGYTTAKEMILFLKQLLNHSLLSFEFCEEILKMMRNQQIDYRFSRYLPTVYNYVNSLISDFGSKTGEIDYPSILANIGFLIDRQGRRHCICIFVENIPSLEVSHFYIDHPVHKNIARTVKIIFEELN